MENLKSHIQIRLNSFKITLNMIILTSNQTIWMVHFRMETKWFCYIDIWRCTIMWCERFLPGECPSEWAHLALEPDEYFYPQWGWDERWAVPALQCASEGHLTGCPMIQAAAPQRKSSYLRTKKQSFHRNYLKCSLQFTFIKLHQVPDIHHRTISW